MSDSLRGTPHQYRHLILSIAMDGQPDRTSPYEAEPLLRHRSSLEGVLNFSTPAPLSEITRAQAKSRLYHVLEHFEAAASTSSSTRPGVGYNRPALVRLTYEHARSEESRDLFLHSFFASMGLPLGGDVSDDDVDIAVPEVEGRLRTSLYGFAEYLMDNFFLPLKAASNKTPQPSPHYHSAIQRAQGSALPQELTGTPARVSALRAACLERDRHRCVISRTFDVKEALDRDEGGQDAKDDDGVPLDEDTPLGSLEVAHILPHALTKASLNSPLSQHKHAALEILNMFDVGVVHMVEGADIDRPQNAITLTLQFHQFFGAFQVFFEHIGGEAEPHKYRIDAIKPRLRGPFQLPVTRTLYVAENRTIDPPSRRLLAIHCAIAHILHLSGAGSYIDSILRDAEEIGVRADGTTPLGRLVGLRLGGWVDKVSVQF
ncbi:hypothetical protein MAPG_10947 [Magnaporthiopsis poae ATCC 64411]|uniref:HNH nuclease domain-containing protein n=1 Tax=Magnaporthiopsis poae (strain ATCC 64411 / 73-15) TaxID=644358 RepID=A0A0C4EDY7_MAGP6|nr:hypothetical protein MAPG_10947 [Magnaporthiopsis poae ATCC 64411]